MNRVRTIFNVGLEQWEPIEGVKYDLIWTQWCLGYLTDEQVKQYLEVCKAVLEPDDGIIVVKENLSSSGVDLFHDTDNSITRFVEGLYSSSAIQRYYIG